MKNREALIREVSEEQHKQHVLVRRRRHSPPAGQEHLLHLLKHHPDMNQKDLAEKVHVRPQSLGEMLAKLEENGLVLRTRDPSDGRATLVRLTPAGEQAERDHHEKLMADVALRFSTLSDEELEEYLRLTRKINENLAARLE